jgi:hypothetical protein
MIKLLMFKENVLASKRNLMLVINVTGKKAIFISDTRRLKA